MVSGTSKFVFSFELGSFRTCMLEKWSEGFEGLGDRGAFLLFSEEFHSGITPFL